MTPDGTLSGYPLIELYGNLYQRRIIQQPDLEKLTLHCIVGQLPSVRRMRLHIMDDTLDLRISGCIFSPPDSECERALRFMERIANMVEARCEIITDLSPDNMLHSQTKIVHEYNPVTKEREHKETCRGVLDPEHNPQLHILSIPDATSLFSRTPKHTTQEAMGIATHNVGSEKNHIDREVYSQHHSPYRADMNPTCSLMLVSDSPENLYKTIKRNSFIHRLLIVRSQFSLDSRKSVSVHHSMALDSPSDSEEVDCLVEGLRYVDNYWAKHSSMEIRVTNDAREHMAKLTDVFYDAFGDLGGYRAMNIPSLASRWVEMLWVIAAHHMILRMGDRVTLNDVRYARSYLSPLWRRLLEQMGLGVSVEHMSEKVRMLIGEAVQTYKDMCEAKDIPFGHPVSQLEFLEVMSDADHWACNYVTAFTRMRRYVNAGFFARHHRSSKRYMLQVVKIPEWLCDAYVLDADRRR